MKRIIVTFCAVTLALLITFFVVGSLPLEDEAYVENDAISPYSILEDNLGTQVHVGVSPCITVAQLKSTLRRAANDLESIPARDYMLLNHLTVKAFLTASNSRDITEFAGSIRRYVPLPEDKKANLRWANRTLFGISGRDKYTIMLDEAKISMRNQGFGTSCE